MSMLWAENACCSAGWTLLVSGWRLGYLALQRSLLLSAQYVSNVVWRPSSGRVDGGGDMVRRTSAGIHGVAILLEVVGPRVGHCSRVPVHPGAGGSLVVLELGVVRMPGLSADCERRRRGGVKLHFRIDCCGK